MYSLSSSLCEVKTAFEMFRLSFVVFLYLLALRGSSCRTVYVQLNNECSSGTSIDTSKEESICSSLDEALAMLESDDTLSLSPGTHVVRNFTTDVVRDVSNVTIAGNVSDPQSVVITCLENVGLFFFNISHLTITGVTIEHCGIKGISHVSQIMNVTMEVMDVAYTPASDFSAAIYLAHCLNLELSSVIIRDNRGFGLVGINLLGNVTLHRLQVLHNYPSECVLDVERYMDAGGSGGGMFLLYQDYLEPESESSVADLDTYLEFTESNITDNYVCRLNWGNILDDKLTFSEKHSPHENLPMVGAGGLTFALTQTTFRVKAHFQLSMFRNNSGTYNGAAMHISQLRDSSGSQVIIERCHFVENGVELVRQYGERGTGPVGALLLWYHYSPDPRNVTNTFNKQPRSVVVFNTTFERNMARRGGAVCVVSFGASVGSIQDTLELRDSNFSHNSADFGGAFYLSELSYSPLQAAVSVHLHNIEVTSNSKRDDSLFLSESGIIDVNNLIILLTGQNYISHNHDTAMSLHNAIVSIFGDSLFQSNSGSTGGAIALTSDSYLFLTAPTSVTFYNNSALIAGGAVHVNFDPSPYDCLSFISETENMLHNVFRFSDSENVFVSFVDNVAPLGSAIFGNSLFIGCPWAGGGIDNSLALSREYFEECHLTISPPPSGDNTNIVNTLPHSILPDVPLSNLTVLPGRQVQISLGAFDQLNQSVPLTVFSYLELLEGTASSAARSVIGESNVFLLDNARPYTTVPLRVFGTQNSTYRVSIRSDKAEAELDFDVTLSECPLGFRYNHSTGVCECKISDTLPQVECADNGSVIFPRGLWVGYDTMQSNFASQSCMFDYCNEVTHVFLDDPDTQCKNNRTGVLCGGCEEGYSRILGTSECRKCDNNLVAAIVILFFIGSLLMVLLLSIFGITITHGYANGALFYSSIVGLYLDVTGFSSTVLTASSTRGVIDFINNHNTFVKCFYNGMTDLHLSIFSFCFPLNIIVSLVLMTLFVKYCQTKALRKVLNRVNITHVFATLLFVSYPGIISNCNDLVYFVDVHVGDSISRKWRMDPNQDYLEGLHIFGFVVAVILFTILTPFPLLLLFPNLSLRLPYVKRLKPLLDAFTAPFVDGKQFWIGFRLLFRSGLFLMVLFEEIPRNILLCISIISITILQAWLQPYKTAGRNVFDLLLMANLTTISVLVVAGQITDKTNTIETAIFVLLVIASVTITGLLVAYIFRALPWSDKLVRFVKNTFILVWAKLETLVEKSACLKAAAMKIQPHKTPTAREMATVVTHTSLHVTTIPISQTGHNVSVSQYVAYRESLLDTTDM